MEKTYTVGNNYYTEDERKQIVAFLKGNDPLVKLLRKALIPKVDTDGPGSLIDVYSAIPFHQLSPEECKTMGAARNMLIEHINLVINSLWTLANSEPKTKEELEKMREQNSNK